MEHPSNVAVALDACEEAGVERETALAGMHKVKPDLGALIAWNLDLNGKNIQFINGMAANDPVSTLQIWKFIMDRYPAEGGTCVFFNSREDRPSRTRQMIELTFLEIKPDYFIVRGDKVFSSIERQKHHSENTRVNVIGLDDPIEKIIEKMAEGIVYLTETLKDFLTKDKKSIGNVTDGIGGAFEAAMADIGKVWLSLIHI